MVETGTREGELKEIAAVSGASPVFDGGLLRSLEWAANRYVAPLSVLLERARPPNLPRGGPREWPPPAWDEPGAHPLRDLARAASKGSRRPVSAIVDGSPPEEWIASVAPVLAAGRTALVVVASAEEARALGSAAQAHFGERMVLVAGDDAAELTKAWDRARLPGCLVVATPRAACWELPSLALAVVVEEGRRAMKDRQTPTLHVRDLMITRARVEGFALAFAGPTPSLEVLAAGAEVIPVGRRAWPLIEVVDRSNDPPGSGFLSERVVAALRATVAEAGAAFVFTHRRAGDASMRCSTCRRIRDCERCGSRLGRVETCPRCGLPTGPCRHCGSTAFEEMGTVPERLVGELARRLGSDRVGVSPTELPIAVGTERDLTRLGPQRLVVAVDADGLMLGHDFRASEEALRVLARVANTLEPGPGRRMMVQTSMPGSELMSTLRRGNPIPYLEALLLERARLGLPPATEMIAVELRGEVPVADADAALRAAGGAEAFGPASGPGSARWLLQGDLSGLRGALRGLAQAWREQGLTVRIDSDPIDL